MLRNGDQRPDDLPEVASSPCATRGKPALPDLDFDRTPFLVIWETTRACDLACLHCRAEAIPCRSPGELSTLDAIRLMNDVRRFGRPLFVLTGGDPFKRPDLLDIVEHGARIGLRMGITPSATPLVTDRALRELRDAGLSRLAISIDGPTAESHDWFRGTDGSFDRSLEILQAARELGLSTQVNTTLTRTSIGRFDEMAELVEDLGISLWSLFFLVPTGRAQERDVAEADAFEEAFHRMYDLSRRAPFDIKSTAAPHYRRVILQRQVEERKAGLRDAPPEPLTAGIGFSLRRSAAGGIPAGRAKGVNDGSGFLFVSHVGEIYPSGFLPLTVGNVMEHDIVQVYREDPLLQALRDPDALKGKCGVCEFRSVCGGSRARAWAVTGNPLESEPFCSYIPARWRRKLEQDEAEARVGMAGGVGQSAHRAVRDPARTVRPGLRLPTVG